MIRINFSNGKTAAFNLREEVGASRLARVVGDVDLQAQIRGAAVARSEFTVAVPSPIGFDRVIYAAEEVRDRAGSLVGDRLTLITGDVQIDVLLYERTPMARVTVRRVGQPRHLAQIFDKR